MFFLTLISSYLHLYFSLFQSTILSPSSKIKIVFGCSQLYFLQLQLQVLSMTYVTKICFLLTASGNHRRCLTVSPPPSYETCSLSYQYFLSCLRSSLSPCVSLSDPLLSSCLYSCSRTTVH